MYSLHPFHMSVDKAPIGRERRCTIGHTAAALASVQSEVSRDAARYSLLDGGGLMNHDELEGKAEALKGKLKQAAGDLMDNPALHDEGVADEVAGRSRDAAGHVRRKVGEAIEELVNALKK